MSHKYWLGGNQGHSCSATIQLPHNTLTLSTNSFVSLTTVLLTGEVELQQLDHNRLKLTLSTNLL